MQTIYPKFLTSPPLIFGLSLKELLGVSIGSLLIGQFFTNSEPLILLFFAAGSLTILAKKRFLPDGHLIHLLTKKEVLHVRNFKIKND